MATDTIDPDPADENIVAGRDDDAAAETALEEIRAHAAETLRRQLPWLKTEAIEKLLKGSEAYMRSGVIEQKPVMAASRKRISFLSLSAELRNRIYDLVIEPQELCLLYEVDPNEVEYASPSVHAIFESVAVTQRSKLITPALSRTCRQVRAELLPMFFDQTTFLIYVDLFHDFGEEGRQRLLRTWQSQVADWFKALDDNADKIKRFYVRVGPTEIGPCRDGQCFSIKRQFCLRDILGRVHMKKLNGVSVQMPMYQQGLAVGWQEVSPRTCTPSAIASVKIDEYAYWPTP